MALIKLQLALFTRSYDLDQNALRDLRAKVDQLNSTGSQFQMQDIPFFDAKEVPKFVCRNGNFEATLSSMKFDFFWSSEEIHPDAYQATINDVLARIRTLLSFNGSPSLYSRIGFIRTTLLSHVDESALVSAILSPTIVATNPKGIRLNYTLEDLVDTRPCNRVITLQSAKLATNSAIVTVLEEDLNTRQDIDLSVDLNSAIGIFQGMSSHHSINELAERILAYGEQGQGS